jgi:Tol biopolymer transport system component
MAWRVSRMRRGPVLPLVLVLFWGCGGGDPVAPAAEPDPVPDSPVEVEPLVVFDMRLDGQRDLWQVRLDGTDLARLTDHPSDDMEPAIAGDQVVFVGVRHGNPELLRIPLEPREQGVATPERLTTTQGAESTPAASADGGVLAWSYNGSGVPKLHLAVLPGAGALPAPGTARVTAGLGSGGSVEVSPSWSPDGQEVVFVSTHEGNANLYLMELAGGGVRPLLVGASAYVQPAFSPDGSWVAYASNEAGPTDLWRIPVTGGSPERLTTGAATDAAPAWLPDGRLVHVRSHPDGSAELRWIDPDRPHLSGRIPLPEGARPNHPTTPREPS